MMSFVERYGPWALITGASEGTGSAFAHRLADEGINCILVARREAPLQALAQAIRAKGVECVTASVDLSALDATDRIVAAEAWSSTEYPHEGHERPKNAPVGSSQSFEKRKQPTGEQQFAHSSFIRQTFRLLSPQ
jgi:shikimate 5-dehydrogenase